MTNENEQRQHTARGEAAIRCAKDECYRLVESTKARIALSERESLPQVAPERREEAQATFRERLADPQFRLSFALWAYEGCSDPVRGRSLRLIHLGVRRGSCR